MTETLTTREGPEGPDATDGTDGGTRLLRTVLRLDAAASGALGVLAAAGGAAGVLADPLGIPGPVLVGVGLFLVVYAAGLVALAAPARVPRAGAWTVVVGNAGWVLASVAFVLLAAPTVLGTVVVLAQALAVALLAELQFTGLRRAQRPAR